MNSSQTTLSSPRKPSRTIRIFASTRKCRRVARRISRITSSSGSLTGTVFCLVFAPKGLRLAREPPLLNPNLDPQALIQGRR